MLCYARRRGEGEGGGEIGVNEREGDTERGWVRRLLRRQRQQKDFVCERGISRKATVTTTALSMR